MEKVLDVYMRPYDRNFPVICMDESPRQLIDEVKTPIPGAPGRPARYDYEYKRHGVCNVFMANEPLAGKRMVKVTARRTQQDWALFITEIEQSYPEAEKITLVMDNLNTHKAGSLYETFSPEQAKKLWDRFDFVYTPKHGSWLNMAEIGRNRIECSDQAVPQSKDCRPGNCYCRSRGMAGSQEHAKCDY